MSLSNKQQQPHLIIGIELSSSLFIIISSWHVGMAWYAAKRRAAARISGVTQRVALGALAATA